MYSDKKYFLWPESKKLSISDFFKKNTVHDIESLLKKYWPNTFPVLFSSSRSSLSAILQYLNFSRNDLVWTPPYSSHCLFDSIGRVASPITVPSNDIKAAIIYHQWGFTCSHQWDSNLVTIIEDSVDTLFLPEVDIFSCNGRFVLQSLPKVFGCIYGGVAYCKSYEDYLALSKIRDMRGISVNQSMLRAFSRNNRTAYLYWHGAESLHGGLPYFALNNIYKSLLDLNKIIDNRIDFLDKVSRNLRDAIINSGRVPSNLPISADEEVKQIYLSNEIIRSGLRHYNISRNAPNITWKLVAPLPLHIGINYNELCKVIPTLKLKNKVKDEFNFL